MNAGTHIGEVIAGDDKHPGQPFFAKCSCGTEGRFPREEQARWWMGEHLARRGGQWKPAEEEAPSGGSSPAVEDQQDDARVQARDAALGIEAGTEGEKQETGDSDSPKPSKKRSVRNQ